MTPAEPFYARGEQFAIDLPGARAVFTTRRGGFSGGPYASLNLGRLTDDDPLAVEQNRAAVRPTSVSSSGSCARSMGPTSAS